MLLNASISVKTSPTNTKLGDFVNLGVLFLTMWINSANPIIYRLLPSPSRYEIKQLGLAYGHIYVRVDSHVTTEMF